MALELKNIAITGYRWFIGTHLCKSLESHGINHIPFSWDLLNKEEVRLFFETHRVDQIIHLVGRFEEPFDMQMRLNIETTSNLLEVGVPLGLKKIIFTSTGAVYGEPLRDESYESDRCSPNTLYGVSKRCTEELVEFYSKYHWVTGIILRFPAVYGEWNTKWVIYQMKRSILSKKEVAIYGDGLQARNFLHVYDAVQALELALSYNESNTFNISNPSRVTIQNLVDEYTKIYDFTVNYQPANNNLKDLSLNIDKAKKELHFVPQVTQLRLW